MAIRGCAQLNACASSFWHPESPTHRSTRLLGIGPRGPPLQSTGRSPIKGLALPIVAAVVLAISAPATAHPQHHQKCSQLISRAWNQSRWRRGQPKDSTIQAFRSSQCSRRAWREAQRRYYERRSRELFRVRVTPYYCSESEMTFDGGWYAIPCVNVNAESGGRGGWTCNTYGVIDGPWGAYGGFEFAGTACAASEHDQSIVAHHIYQDVGTAAWTPFEP